MPNVQQKRINKGGLMAVAFAVAMVGVFMLKINIWFKIAIDVALILLFLFLRRGYIYFYRGAMAMNKGPIDKTWANFEKAINAGVDTERKVMIGSAYIQRGDASRGVEILEKVIANPKTGDFANTATITCSMGYWRLGELDKAISILEDLSATGYEDDNLSVNLESYLLEIKDLKRAKQAMDSGRPKKTETNGLMDNRGWYYIQKGDWDNAKKVYDELIDDRNAKFPEAYLHGAQVSIHEGDIQQAIDRLSWGISKKFFYTCMFEKEYMEKILLGLENPKTRESFAKAMEENRVDISIGKPFPGLEIACDFDEDESGVIKPQEKPTVSRTDPAVAQKTTKAAESEASTGDSDINTDVDDDDREPNTDLDDEDAELAVKLGYDDSQAEAETPDTAIDDEDDREPNTDLDDED